MQQKSPVLEKITNKNNFKKGGKFNLISWIKRKDGHAVQ